VAVADLALHYSEINALVLDYLTNAGYAEAAAKFSKEANIQPMQDDDAIRVRRGVLDMVHQGNIEEAAAALNDLDPEVRRSTFSHLLCPSCL
jgi:glucose-induced degradation protein 8